MIIETIALVHFVQSQTYVLVPCRKVFCKEDMVTPTLTLTDAWVHQ
jgi:hypothetical protein